MNETATVTVTSGTSALRNLSVQDFLSFGVQHIAYVRPVIVEDRPGFGLYAADGRMLSFEVDAHAATLAARNNGLAAMSIQ